MIRYPARFWQEEDGWLAEFPTLQGIMTCADTLEELAREASECLECHLLSRLDKNLPLPTPGELPLDGVWVEPSPVFQTAVAVRQLRQQAGLTQAQAAERLGVTQVTYRRWEDPEACNATLKTLEKIARAFGRRVRVEFAEAG